MHNSPNAKQPNIELEKLQYSVKCGLSLTIRT